MIINCFNTFPIHYNNINFIVGRVDRELGMFGQEKREIMKSGLLLNVQNERIQTGQEGVGMGLLLSLKIDKSSDNRSVTERQKPFIVRYLLTT